MPLETGLKSIWELAHLTRRPKRGALPTAPATGSTTRGSVDYPKSDANTRRHESTPDKTGEGPFSTKWVLFIGLHDSLAASAIGHHVNQWRYLRFSENSPNFNQYSTTDKIQRCYIDRFSEFSLNLRLSMIESGPSCLFCPKKSSD